MGEFLPVANHNVFHNLDEVLSTCEVKPAFNAVSISVLGGSLLKVADCRAAEDSNIIDVTCYAGYVYYHYPLMILNGNGNLRLNIFINGVLFASIVSSVLFDKIGIYSGSSGLCLPCSIKDGDRVEAYIVSDLTYLISGSPYSAHPICLMRLKYVQGL